MVGSVVELTYRPARGPRAAQALHNTFDPAGRHDASSSRPFVHVGDLAEHQADDVAGVGLPFNEPSIPEDRPS